MHWAIVFDCLDAIEHLPLIVFYLLGCRLVWAEHHSVAHFMTLTLLRVHSYSGIRAGNCICLINDTPPILVFLHILLDYGTWENWLSYVTVRTYRVLVI